MIDERLEQLFHEFRAQQRLPEYLAVAGRIRKRLGALRAVIEIGSASGGTLALWSELARPDALLVSVDVRQGPEECYSDDALRRVARGRRLALVRGDSWLPESREAVAQALENAQADLLFIDSDHHAAVVRSELRAYAPFVRDGGIVAFHDVVPHPEYPDVRVHELWWELRARFPRSAEEILEAPDQTWGGIGLLTMGPEVRAYISGPEPIPVFINNFNRLKTTRALAEWVANLAGARVVILDNNSDWDPLLDWYERCPFEVRRLGANLGQRAPWISGAVKGVTVRHYVVTDPDLAMEGCPADVLEVLADGLARYPWATKAGVGLEIDDIPAEYPSRDLVIGLERQYWQHKLDSRFFRAAVDTTFALYRSGEDPSCGPALRSDRPYVARHLPWYMTPATLDEEERHFLRTADPRFSSGTSHAKSGYDAVAEDVRENAELLPSAGSSDALLSGQSDRPPPAVVGEQWRECGPVECREAEGILFLQKQSDWSPGSERGISSSISYEGVSLSFEVFIPPGACFVAKINQLEALDQTANSYHLYCDDRAAYLARHHHVFGPVPVTRQTWESFQLTYDDGVLCLSKAGRLLHRDADDVLPRGYAFLGVKAGRVRLRNVSLVALRGGEPAAPQVTSTSLRLASGEGASANPSLGSRPSPASSGVGISYCIAVMRPTYARRLVDELVCKSSVPYEVLLWLNVSDDGLEAFLDEQVARGVPIRVVGKTPENLGMRAYRELFRAARHPLLVQIDDDVVRVSRGIAERAARLFTKFPKVRQIVSDVWQDEYTTGARPPLQHYRCVDEREGLYDGPIDGWFSIYHRSILPVLLALPYSEYCPIGGMVRQQLQNRGLSGLLCTRMRVFHVIGPQYASLFGMLEAEVEKYRRLGRLEIVDWYLKAMPTLPPAEVMRQHFAAATRTIDGEDSGWMR